MFKIKGNHRSLLVRLGLILAAAVLPLASAVAPMATASSSGEAVLVSAAGNVIETADEPAIAADGPTIELAAVYYWGWYSTKAACTSALNAKLATGQYWGGGCVYYNQYPHYNTYQLWLDEKTCTDRVAPTNVNAASIPQKRPLAEV